MMHNFMSLLSLLINHPEKVNGFVDDFTAELISPPPVDPDPQIVRCTVSLQSEADKALEYLAKRFGRSKSGFMGDILEMYALDIIHQLKLHTDQDFISYLRSENSEFFYSEVNRG